MSIATLTAERFRKLYKYEPLTGKFICNHVGPRRIFGQEAVPVVQVNGYAVLRVDNKPYYIHRLAVLYMCGEFPAVGTAVDHINRDRTDNRWENLRIVTAQQNCMNAGIRSDNTSGVRGVQWWSTRKVWRARITVNGKEIILGQYATKDEAIAARRSAEHKYHGEYATKD